MQLVQEARPLAWPWVLTLAAGIYSAVILSRPVTFWPVSAWHETAGIVLYLGVFFAIPLLAILPIGNEFQHRTLALRLSQPVPRQTFWTHKILVAIAAVVPLAVLDCISFSANFGHAFLLLAIIWIVVTTAGAIPFTLIARSTIGGLVLSGWIYLAAAYGWVYYKDHGNFSTAALSTIAALVFAYAIAMLWLGRRMVLRYQAADGMQAGETFIPGAALLPGFLVAGFRPRPRGALLNLVRREFHLLRVIWPLSVIAVLAWIVLVPFLNANNAESHVYDVLVGLNGLISIVIAVLCGVVSLGEEKQWGTHPWHLTLPISSTLQWLVKLAVALFTSVFAGAVLPVIVLFAGRALRHYAFPLDHAILWGWPLASALITIAAFWAACVAKETVRSVMWLFVVTLAVALAAYAGYALYSASEGAIFDLEWALIWKLDPIRVQSVVHWILINTPLFQWMTAIVATPLFLVILIATRRRFVESADDTNRRVLRVALPLLLATFLPVFAQQVFDKFVETSWTSRSALLADLHRFFEAQGARLSQASPSAPLHLSADEIERAGSFSWKERTWLGNATIEISPAPFVQRPMQYAPPRGFGSFAGLAMRAPGVEPLSYTAVIHRGNGTRCDLSFITAEHAGFGMLRGQCK
jgi:hypothetical protein